MRTDVAIVWTTQIIKLDGNAEAAFLDIKHQIDKRREINKGIQKVK
jgi:hypothetical protein